MRDLIAGGEDEALLRTLREMKLERDKLVESPPRQEPPGAARDLAAAFRDLTRLASGEPELAHGIAFTNRKNLLHWLDRFHEELNRMGELVAGGDEEALFKLLLDMQFERDRFIENPPRREPPGSGADLPSASDALVTLLGGDYWQRRLRQMKETSAEQRRERELMEKIRRQEREDEERRYGDER